LGRPTPRHPARERLVGRRQLRVVAGSVTHSGDGRCPRRLDRSRDRRV